MSTSCTLNDPLEAGGVPSFLRPLVSDYSVTLGATSRGCATAPESLRTSSHALSVNPLSRVMLYDAVTTLCASGWWSSRAEDQRAARPEPAGARAVALIEKWLADGSGYDERVWPQLKASIEDNRLSDRKRFRE